MYHQHQRDIIQPAVAHYSRYFPSVSQMDNIRCPTEPRGAAGPETVDPPRSGTLPAAGAHSRFM